MIIPFLQYDVLSYEIMLINEINFIELNPPFLEWNKFDSFDLQISPTKTAPLLISPIEMRVL